MTNKRILVFANEKGGTGKSTTAMHTAIALLREGRRVACIDLDSRQATFSHYARNRKAFADSKGIALPVPNVVRFDYSAETDRGTAAAADNQRLRGLIQELGEHNDFVILDSPGTDVPVVRTAIVHADTLITPLNDSFVDLDLLGEISGSPPRVVGPSIFSQTVWEARQSRARSGQGPIDWIVLRNRLSPLDSRNKRNVGVTLGQLADRMGFRLVDGFYERVIFRQMFLQGLTVLDLKDDGSDPALNLSHVAARQEIGRLIHAIENRRVSDAPSDQPAPTPVPPVEQLRTGVGPDDDGNGDTRASAPQGPASGLPPMDSGGTDARPNGSAGGSSHGVGYTLQARPPHD